MASSGKHIIVIGGSVTGLGAGLALTADGHRVTILEGDAAPMPESHLDAFEWKVLSSDDDIDIVQGKSLNLRDLERGAVEFKTGAMVQDDRDIRVLQGMDHSAGDSLGGFDVDRIVDHGALKQSAEAKAALGQIEDSTRQ